MRRAKRFATALFGILLAGSVPAAGHPLSTPNGNWASGQYHYLGTQLTVGNQVAMWQTILLWAGQIPCSGVDGIYGPQSTAGTKNVQAFFGLTPDGVVGPNTWNLGSAFIYRVSPPNLISFWALPNNDLHGQMYKWHFGGQWEWLMLWATTNFEQYHHSSHPGITFGHTSSCK